MLLLLMLVDDTIDVACANHAFLDVDFGVVNAAVKDI